MVWASCCMIMAKFMKEVGAMMKKKVKDMSFSLAKINTLANTEMANLMAWENMNGITDKFTKGSGKKAKDTALELGKEQITPAM